MATGRGDDGTTGLLFGGRITKDDARAEAYGTLDEAVACLGLARAEIAGLADAGRLPAALTRLDATILGLQRDLFVAGAELATNPDAWDRLRDGETRVDEAMLASLEEVLRGAEQAVEVPRRVRRAGRDPFVRHPRAGSNGRPTRRAAGHRPRSASASCPAPG